MDGQLRGLYPGWLFGRRMVRPPLAGYLIHAERQCFLAKPLTLLLTGNCAAGRPSLDSATVGIMPCLLMQNAEHILLRSTQSSV